jgi:hypothetical protein
MNIVELPTKETINIVRVVWKDNSSSEFTAEGIEVNDVVMWLSEPDGTLHVIPTNNFHCLTIKEKEVDRGAKH